MYFFLNQLVSYIRIIFSKDNRQVFVVAYLPEIHAACYDWIFYKQAFPFHDNVFFVDF